MTQSSCLKTSGCVRSFFAGTRRSFVRRDPIFDPLPRNRSPVEAKENRSLLERQVTDDMLTWQASGGFSMPRSTSRPVTMGWNGSSATVTIIG